MHSVITDHWAMPNVELSTAESRIDSEATCALAISVLTEEAQAIQSLTERIDKGFVNACRILLDCRGRVVVTGMGKSGHIGGKIAATLASTGTPAFFVHPGEASHGDLGMITRNDVVIALSNSGETDELLTILPLLRRLGVPLVALTGNPASRLAQEAQVHLDVSVAREACPLGLAPTTSTTAALAMGDALAVALLNARGFTADDFARSHPGGRLGRRLLIHVSDVMRKGSDLPIVQASAVLRDALLEISSKGLGIAFVCDSGLRIEGVFTDGDLRRAIDRGLDVRTAIVSEAMTTGGISARAQWLAVEALRIMDEGKISALPVVNDENRLIGALNMHDLLRAGVA
jgi:arabinose-5-phosphate isomerase